MAAQNTVQETQQCSLGYIDAVRVFYLFYYPANQQ